MAYVYVAVGSGPHNQIWVHSTEAVHTAVLEMHGVTKETSGEESYTAEDQMAYNRFLLRIRS